ncbi:MAG: ABC transporter substrate-binding protein, partial [Myxococcales bacterium]|nr:ABC transporter substrate-binding protein [Myxococcales bacterium]
MTRRSKKTPPANTLRVGMLGPWQGLDPWEAQDLSGVIVRNQCFETLYHRRGGRPQGDRRYLANDLQLETIGPDGKPRYTMRLAEDLRFSDGRLVTPDDVVDSLEHVAPLRAMAKITAAGGRRLQFTCYDSDALLEPQLAQIWSVIGRRSPKFWLGTGPYMMVEESKGEEGQVLVLERNPHWVPVARKPPAIERIVFSTFKTDASGQPTALREAIEAEEIDFTLVLPREVAKGLQGVRKIYQPGQSTAFLAFNCKRPWLDRPEARQALSAAIDPWAIARICHDNPAAFAARGLLPPAMAPTQRSLPKYGASVATAALEAIGDKP